MRDGGGKAPLIPGKAMVPRLGVAACLFALLAGCHPTKEPIGSPTDPGAPSPSPSAARSSNMALLAHLDMTALTGGLATGAGNWGYTTPGGRRFALTGTSAGLSIAEVTDPARARRVALISGPASAWREVRTYGDNIYVTTEATHGIDIVSMRDPDNPVKVQTWNRTVARAHSLWIDEDRGLLFVNGANGSTGGMRILDLTRNPDDPREVGSFSDYYIHDSYSRGNVLFASAITSGFESLLDIRDPGNVREITRFNTGGRFTHNSWLTTDGRYLFTTDERQGRPVEGWDMTDIRSPRKVTEFTGNPAAIAHNVMIDGDRLLIAHYTEGVYLLDIRNPEQPRVMGFYDTFPGPSGGFAGTWGAYIFPGSNLIIASDMSGGLFVLQYTGP